MKKELISKKRLIIITLLFSYLLQAGWISFNKSGLNQPKVELISSNYSSTSFHITIPGCETEIINTEDMINTNNEAFGLLTIPETYYTGDIGKPKLPAIKQTIGVPYNAKIEIEIINSKYKDINLESLGLKNRIMPVLESVIKMPGQKPVLVVDEATYSQDELYPQEIVRIEKVDIMRGHRLAIIEVAPIQYNPVSNMIRYYTDIEIKITFIGGDMVKTRQMVAQDYSPLYEDFIEKRVLNYEFFANITRDVPPLPIHYLIVTHNNFQNQINNLAYWLSKKGFKVKVANQDSISPWTSANIENYIDAQSPAPTYLLLVGDVNGSYMPAPTGTSSGKVTDLYYAELDGSGYLPDIFYGRLSCETETHITTMVDKILKYEKANLPAGWFKDDAFCAGNDNYTVSEGTHNYCTSTFMDPNGYTTYKLYEQTYGATTQDVFDNVNAGRTLITMSGHGSDDGWHDGPPFTVTHVNQLTNGDHLTIATGHCCNANNFGSSTNPCGGESWIRKENGGAVAYYGACPGTYWDEDDWLQREWYEAIYADSIYEHARFTLDGMYDGVELSGSSRKRYYYEGYHVLGDPSLDLWTEIPAAMTVTHDAIVFPGASNFTVTVNHGGTPLEDALVCCWIPEQSPQIHVSDYTNASGTTTLNISPTTPGDTMYVTVTKHNYIPYEEYALVTTSSGPYVVLGTQIIDDASGGNNDGVINPGETINYGIYGKNVGTSTAFSIFGLLSETDPNVSLTTDSSWYGNILADDSLLSDPYYQFTVANDCPNNYAISFTLEFHDINDSIWISNPSIMVYAPVLTFEQVSVVNDNNGNGILDPGEDADLIVTIENEGGATAENITSTLITSSSYITINDSSGNFGSIDPGNTANNAADPYTVTASPSTPYGTEIDFEIEVVSGIYIDTLDFVLVVGQLVPSDTGLYYAYYSGGPHLQSPVFEWIAIDSTQIQNPGTSLNLSDDQTVQISLPFTFVYYGVNYTQISICSNGWIAMGVETSTDYTNTGIPNSDGPEAMIAGLWDDLDPGNSGQPSDVYYYYDASNNRFIVQWFRCEHYSSGYHEDFEIILYDPVVYPTPTGDGEIIVQYLIEMQQSDNTLGIENFSETVGIQYYLDGTYDPLAAVVTDSFAIKYTTYPPDWVGIEEEGGFANLPLKTLLGVISPNPFRRVTAIRFSIGDIQMQDARSKKQDISLKIYDASGRLVKDFNLQSEICNMQSSVVWDGTDQNARKVPAGVYFVRFEAGDYSKTEKAILLR